MLAIVQKDIEKLLRAAGVAGEIPLAVPPDQTLGDISFPCFTLAKEQKKNPAELAREIAAKISVRKNSSVESVRAAGPYVNFFLQTSTLAKTLAKELSRSSPFRRALAMDKKRTCIIEYPSNNTHKEFHIGHFRNVCIGNTLVQLLGATGNRAIPVNYLNDFGAHVVRCLWGLQKFHAGEAPPANKERWLAEIYIEASRYVKEHPEVKDELNALQTKLESHDPSIWPLFLETRQWSIDGIQKLFTELGVVHDYVFFEKDIKDRGQAMVDDLLQKGIATVGEGGAIIVDLSKENLGVAVLRKSTGGGLYMTSDLALAEVKYKTYKKAYESITITGSEQTTYFKQLFMILAWAGFEKKMTHIGYGLVNTPEGKMASRVGNVILYEDLRDSVFKNIEQEVLARHPDWAKEKIAQVTHTLTMAVLKFTMQKHEAAKNIVFDMKEAVSFEGFTAPYVLYAVARINSLIRKSSEGVVLQSVVHLGEKSEKKLLLLLAEYSDVVHKALGAYNPSVIAKYCFDLAQAFNEFYNSEPILTAPTPELRLARLALSSLVRDMLVRTLHLLTIDTVEEM